MDPCGAQDLEQYKAHAVLCTSCALVPADELRGFRNPFGVQKKIICNLGKN